MKLQYTMGLVIVAMSLVGCADRQTVTETKYNNDGTQVVTTTKTHGFWESENLSNHYEFENNRVDRNAENVTKKIDAIQTQAMLAIGAATTQNEKVLVSALAMTQLNTIQTTPSASGMQAPKTSVDMLDRNLVGFANLGLNAWNTFGNNRGDDISDSPSIVNSGAGDVFYMSSNNKNPQYNLNATGESSVNGTFDDGIYYDTSSTQTNEQITTSTTTQQY